MPITPITASAQERLRHLHPVQDYMTGLWIPQVSHSQPGTVIVCEDLPFVVSSNSKIYNFTGGNMKQLYITDPSKHTFLVKAANSPNSFSGIFSSVLGLLPRFEKSKAKLTAIKMKTRNKLQPRLQL